MQNILSLSQHGIAWQPILKVILQQILQQMLRGDTYPTWAKHANSSLPEQQLSIFLTGTGRKSLTKRPINSISSRCAEVAELVDALDSGSSVRMDVGVRLSSSAPSIFQGFIPVILG